MRAETGLAVSAVGVTRFASGRNSGLIGAFLAGRSPRTLQAYRADLEDFAGFLGVSNLEEAAMLLLSRGLGEANRLALGYRASLLDRRLQPATVNRRLAALRSLVKLARTLGVVSWTLELPNVRSRAYRDTSGPGIAGFKRLLANTGNGTAKSIRDRAILRLLYDLALRRGEIVSLDMKDVNVEGRTIAILGKGRTQKENLSLPAPTREALEAWIRVRGEQPGPLFSNMDRAGKGKRLTGTGLYLMVQALGQKSGLTVRPHGIRHSSVTAALDLMNGDVRAVQRFSRHKSLQTVLIYDDNRRNLAGEVAAKVAAGVGED